MEPRLSRFGIGPRIILSALACAALAGAATYAWPDVCVVGPAPYRVLRILGSLLLLAGIPMWLIAVVAVMKAYDSDRLVTSGIFSLCRHPVYAAWIVLNLPGLVLLAGSWPLMITPLVAYAVFKSLIHREDEYLEKRFGPAYLAYRRQVNELLPIPKV